MFAQTNKASVQQSKKDTSTESSLNKRKIKQKKTVLADNRPETVAQKKHQEGDSALSPKQSIQKKPLEDNRAKPKSAISSLDNNTGLPHQLKSGIENLSGHSMDDVKVHYNSDKPAQLQAHAYAQGTDIHLGSGQEKHLPHEAWHVVQQKQGRVKPTKQMKGKVAINDDAGLEQEADVMGAKALQLVSSDVSAKQFIASKGGPITQLQSSSTIIQAAGFATALVTGEETGDISADLLVKTIRTNLIPSKQAVIYALLGAFDHYVGVPTVSSWSSWLYSQLSGEAIKKVLSWVSPAYAALLAARKVFLLLPIALQSIIMFVIAKGFRKFLGSMSSLISEQTADHIVEFIFASDPTAAFNILSDWLHGLQASPTTFLYQKYGQQPEQTTGDKSTNKKQEVEQRKDNLINLDTEILKLQIGNPKLTKTVAPENPKKTEDETSESNQSEVTPGGLTFPFNFAIHIFDRDLKATQNNKLTMPWNGGFYLRIPSAELQVNAELGNVFKVGSLMARNLVVTDKGLLSIGLALEPLSLANNTVKFKSIGGEWSKENGTRLKGDGEINAMNNSYGINIDFTLNKQGHFNSAKLTVKSAKKLDVINNVFTIDKPVFEGGITNDKVMLAFMGDPSIQALGMNLDAKKMRIAYSHGKSSQFDLEASNLKLSKGKLALEVIKPSYRSGQGIHADKASLQYGEKDEQDAETGSWLSKHSSDKSLDWTDALKFAPQASFSVPDIWLKSSAPYLSMGKPSVAKISLSMLGLQAMLDFQNKKGSLAGAFDYQKHIPIFSMPFPIVPGVEAFVDIDANAQAKASLNGELAKVAEGKPPWAASADTKFAGSLGMSITAGVQLGSQLAVALAAGLKAQAKGDLDSQFKVSGQLQFADKRISRVPGQPMLIHYHFKPTVSASVGIVLQAKAFYVYKKTLYEREFGNWELGRYNLAGDLSWDGEKWSSTEPKAKFSSPKLNEPEANDKVISLTESREILSQAGVAIAGGAELRQALVDEVIAEYKKRDVEVYHQLDTYFKELVDLKYRRELLAKRTLSSIRFRSELKQLKLQVNEAEQTVERLRQTYREVLLVLVQTGNVIRNVSDGVLDLDGGSVAEQLEKIHLAGAKIARIRSSTNEVKKDIKSIKEQEESIQDEE